VGSTTVADLARRDKPLTISLTLSSILQKQPSGESSLEGCFHLECLQLIYHTHLQFYHLLKNDQIDIDKLQKW